VEVLKEDKRKIGSLGFSGLFLIRTPPGLCMCNPSGKKCAFLQGLMLVLSTWGLLMCGKKARGICMYIPLS